MTWHQQNHIMAFDRIYKDFKALNDCVDSRDDENGICITKSYKVK